MSDKSIIAEQLGKTIKREREARPISQEAFADKIGLHRTYMSSVERGLRNVSIGNVVKIAEGLGMTASQLLEKAGL